jgi:AICAR transformylase/IMP cyclohydrolase PurH
LGGWCMSEIDPKILERHNRLPRRLGIIYERIDDPASILKYGRNPKLAAALYRKRITVDDIPFEEHGGFLDWKHHRPGDYEKKIPRLGANNIKEIVGVRKLLDGFNNYDPESDDPLSGGAVAIETKHGITCSFGYSKRGTKDELKAFSLAKELEVNDPNLVLAYLVSEETSPFDSFGGVGGVNFKVPMEVAQAKNRMDDRGFRELLGSTRGYEKGVVEEFLKKQTAKMRLFTFKEHGNFPYEILDMDGVAMISEQATPNVEIAYEDLSFPMEKPNEEIIALLMMSGKVVARVPSNGIGLGDGRVEDGMVTRFDGYGFGSSTARYKGCQQAVDNMTDPAVLECPNLILSALRKKPKRVVGASDGFFPWWDNIKILADGGVEYMLVCAGGMKKRQEMVLKVAEENGLELVYYHGRLFW